MTGHINRALLLACALLLLPTIVACGRPIPPTPGLVEVPLPTATPIAETGSPEYSVLAVVAAEAEAVRQQDIDVLRSLWLADGVVTDAMRTPDNASDDRIWHGWEEIQARYVQAVLPYVSDPVEAPRPQSVEPSLTIQDDSAEVTVPGPDGRSVQDRWELRRVAGSWRIYSLTFNLIPLN